MIHALLAATLVTAALLALAVNAWNERSSVGRLFSFSYGTGVVCWGAVAYYTDSTALVFVSAAQFASCMFLLFLTHRQED